jgi:hypothetical protein
MRVMRGVGRKMAHIYGQANLGVKIEWDIDIQAYKIYTPHDAKFVEALKQLIPYSDRSWNEQGRYWIITERFMEPVKMTAEMKWGVKATVKDKETVEKEHAAREAQRKRLEEEARRRMGIATLSPIEKTIVDFVNMLPYEAMKKAYQHGALQLHPDRGGDPAKMSEYNAKWQEIERVFYQRS